MCFSCVQNKFIRGGVENLFNLNCTNNNEFNGSKRDNIKTLKDIYTLNFQLVISQIRNIRIKFMKSIDTINEIFGNTAIRVMFSNNKDSFMNIKKDMDKCMEKMEGINKMFEKLINDCISKEKLKNSYINNLFNINENIFQKEKLLELLKGIEIEITSSPEEIYMRNKDKELENNMIFNNKNESPEKTSEFSLLKNKNIGINNNFNFYKI